MLRGKKFMSSIYFKTFEKYNAEQKFAITPVRLGRPRTRILRDKVKMNISLQTKFSLHRMLTESVKSAQTEDGKEIRDERSRSSPPKDHTQEPGAASTLTNAN